MASKVYPLKDQARLIGSPYRGTHGASAPNNWESRNAYDLDTPAGTPVVAVHDGVIGDQIGPLAGASQSGRFAGKRLHLETADNEFYYAHLSRIVVKAGDHVQEGQVIGYTGVANGVAHLHFAAKNGDPLEAAGQPPTQTTPPTQTPSVAPTAAAAQDSPPADSGQVDVTATPPPNPYADTNQAGSDYVEPGALPPGTVQAGGLPARAIQQSWQLIAAQPHASQDTLRFLDYARLAAGG